MYGFTCEHCGGTVHQRRVDREALRHKESFVILEDVPIGICKASNGRYHKIESGTITSSSISTGIVEAAPADGAPVKTCLKISAAGACQSVFRSCARGISRSRAK